MHHRRLRRERRYQPDPARAGDALMARGGFIVELTVPVEYAGQAIDRVDIAPARFDHRLRYDEGLIPSTLALLCELTGLAEGALRQISITDMERVAGAFMLVLPPHIAADVRKGSFRRVFVPRAPA